MNGSNSFDTADFVSDNTWTTAPALPDTLRLVRINIVARQLRPDQNWGSTQPIIVEDHNPVNDAGYNAQQYSRLRRRLLTRTIEFRNLGL
jgi:hypothetical protein